MLEGLRKTKCMDESKEGKIFSQMALLFFGSRKS